MDASRDATSGRNAHKPLPPIITTLETLDEPTPGQVVRLLLRVTAKVESRGFLVTCTPPSAITWVSGDTTFAGVGRLDVEEEFTFSVRVPTVGRHALHMRIELTTVDGRIWRRGVGIGLGLEPGAAVARSIIEPSGRKLLEYPAAVADHIDQDGRR